MASRASNPSLSPGGGAAGAVIRAKDWSKTPLGPPSRWPAGLMAHVRAMLHTRQPMCIFWGPELINLYNDGFLPILGEKHPEAMGQPAEQCWSEAWPIVGPQLRRVLQGESIFHEEVVVPIARGGRVEDAWWNYSYSPLFDDAGAVAGALVICTEITREVVARTKLEAANREAELARQELQGIFMQAPLPMCILAGADHRFTLANAPYLQLVGRDVVGKTVREAFSDDEAGHYLPILDRVYSTGAPFVLHEAPFDLSDAHGVVDGRFIDAGYYPHRDASGAIAGILVVIHDVTAQVLARKQIEDLAVQEAGARKQAEALRSQAEAANRAKDEFLATVSHELRTPLTAILGWSRILSETTERSRIERGVAIIERNARAQAKIIDDILDVSRIISGKLRLSVRPVDFASIIEAVVESVRPAAAAKQVDLRVEIIAPVQLVADEDRLQQIVWNLLSNAGKFTPRGGVVVVRAFVEGEQVVVQVRDSGRGISPEFLPYVFDRFRQDDASTTKQQPGLGLGLAIVRHLVELHGGTVRAESEGEGRGATFHVALPLGPAERSEGSVPSAVPGVRSSAEIEPHRPLTGVRVLVVDDQQDARELVAMMLEDAGARVLQAASAAAAVEILAGTEVSVIVSDIAMPGGDGYAFLERVRAAPRTRDVPALALTAYARAEDRDRALASGFQAHIAKPIDPARLVVGVRALLRDR